jgi:DNA-binding NarL/FixJ family response regulator
MGTLRNQSPQQKALRYFTMGLTAPEIGKLLDKSPRTIERYIQDNDWKRPIDDRTLQERANALVSSGKSYSEVAKELGICKTTVYNYLKRERAK